MQNNSADFVSTIKQKKENIKRLIIGHKIIEVIELNQPKEVK